VALHRFLTSAAADVREREVGCVGKDSSGVLISVDRNLTEGGTWVGMARTTDLQISDDSEMHPAPPTAMDHTLTFSVILWYDAIRNDLMFGVDYEHFFDRSA